MIRNRLKEIRMQLFLADQKEFAKMLGINLQQYNRYENGVITPKLEAAYEITDKINKLLKDKNFDKKYISEDIFYPVKE